MLVFVLVCTTLSFLTWTRKRELVALFFFCLSRVLSLYFLKVPWVGLQTVIVVLPDHIPFH